MNEAIGAVTSLLLNGNVLGVFLVFLVIILYRSKQFLKLFEKIRKSRIRRVAEALECDHLDRTTREFLEDQLVQRHCKYAIALGEEKQTRRALIRAHKRAEGQLEFSCFKRALPFLTYNHGVLQVNITRKDTVFHGLKAVFGMTISLVAFFVLNESLENLINVTEETRRVDHFPVLFRRLSYSVFYLVGGVLVLMAGIPYNCAQRLRKEGWVI